MAKRRKIRPRCYAEVFFLNCLFYLQSVRSTFDFTNQKQSAVLAVIDERVTLLTDEHSTDVPRDAGLLQVAEACRNHKTDKQIGTTLANTEPADLQRALQHFSMWFSDLEVIHSPRLAQLTVQKLHTQIHQDALACLAKTYRLICEEVKKPANRYEAASTFLGSERPFGQVHLLRQIFGLEDKEGEEDEEESEEDDKAEDDADEEEESGSDEEDEEDE
ncbi:hypothetical protein BDZ97DRAFT_1914342 [Flammula alnicola]|nr:hypothetical protein BDZ97DRAFT_1914342 [Flammula alnicola]